MNNTRRKLTKAEEERLSKFQKQVEELEHEGYVRTDLTADAAKANILGTCYGFLTALPFIILFFLRNPIYPVREEKGLLRLLGIIVIYIVLIILHELAHGLTWSCFAKNRIRSISFGIIWRSLNPYCTCSDPLKKNQYLIGALMPWFLLGIIPCIVGIIFHNRSLMMLAVIMTASAGGDLLLVQMILTHKANDDALYLDHPTEIGLICLEKGQ